MIGLRMLFSSRSFSLSFWREFLKKLVFCLDFRCNGVRNFPFDRHNNKYISTKVSSKLLVSFFF